MAITTWMQSSNDAGLEKLGASDLHHYSSKLDHRDGHYYSKQKGNRKKTVKGDTSNRKNIIEHKNEHSYDQLQHLSAVLKEHHFMPWVFN